MTMTYFDVNKIKKYFQICLWNLVCTKLIPPTGILIIVLYLFPLMTFAEEVQVDGIWYLFKGKIAIVTSGRECVGDLHIPSVVNHNGVEYQVTSIGKSAFSYNRKLVSVSIGDGIVSIEQNAFESCHGLTSIDIPTSLTSIAFGAFKYCSKLSAITIPSGVISIGNEAFDGCSSLQNLNIEDCAETLSLGYNWYSGNMYITGSGQFSNCPLRNVYLGRDLSYDSRRISGFSPFYENHNLESLVISGNVTSIGDFLFRGCTNLMTVIIGENVQSIGCEAFQSCSKLSSISIPNNVVSIGECAFYGCSELVSLSISESVSSIGSSAFQGCLELTSLTIPESVTSIGSSAFEGCKRLQTIVLPSNLKMISGRLFKDCISLTDVTLPKQINRIGSQAFYNCKSLALIYIPDSVVSIGDEAFGWCCNLSYVYLPESVTSIGIRAFKCCESLLEVVIPSKVKTIDDYTFQGCSKLASVNVLGKIVRIGKEAFMDCCSLSSIYIEKDNVSSFSIGYSAFEGCCDLACVVLPENLKKIEQRAFFNCAELSEIYCHAKTVPNTAKDAFDRTFPEYITLHVPETSLDKYKVAYPWSIMGKYETLKVAVEKIVLSQTSINLREDDVYKLTAAIIPNDASDKRLTWHSSNDCVASVDSMGNVTAKSQGSTIITVFANDGGTVSASCEVIVDKEKVYVSDIILDPLSVSLNEGDSFILSAVVLPEHATDKSITWSSDDDNVAIVDKEGKVTAINEGVCLIKATAFDDIAVSSSCKVSVKKKPDKKCSLPIISYENGRVLLVSMDHGVSFITKIEPENEFDYYEESFDFIPTYTFSVFAVKEHYENSDTVNMTICWAECSSECKNEESDGIISLSSRAILIQNTNGVLSFSGLSQNMRISVYDIVGKKLDEAIASNGTATLNTGLSPGNVAVVRISDHCIKLIVK